MKVYFFAAAILVTSVVLFRASQNWDSREGSFLNIFFLLSPSFQVEPILGASLSKQLAFLNVKTQLMENELPEFLVRSWYGQEIAAASFGPTKTKVAELLVPSRDEERKIPVLCSRPSDQGMEGSKLPLVLYFYAGGLVLGSPKAELKQIRYIARATPAVVCAIQYRKAPEYPYPAAVHDALDASMFLIRKGSNKHKQENPLLEDLEVSIDSSKIATFGTSAGGYLSAHTARMLAVEGVSTQLQVSLVPMAKPLGGTQSLLKYGKRDIWNRAWNTFAWTVYLAGDDGKLVNDWTVSLLVDPPGGVNVLANLPPVYLQLHQRDVLYHEGQMYAERLSKQHKLLDVVEYDAIHIESIPPFSNGGPADGSFERAVYVLRRHLCYDGVCNVTAQE